MIKKILFIGILFCSVQMTQAQDSASSIASSTYLEDQVSFYPNPAEDLIKVTNVSGELVEFSVYNILGDKVISAQLTKVETEMSLDKLPSGVYIIAFHANNKTITERLIKE